MIFRDSWTFRTNFIPVRWKQRRWWGWELTDDHQHEDAELWGPNFNNSEHIWRLAVGFYEVQGFFFFFFFTGKSGWCGTILTRGCEMGLYISASNPRLRASMCIFTFSTYYNFVTSFLNLKYLFCVAFISSSSKMFASVSVKWKSFSRTQNQICLEIRRICSRSARSSRRKAKSFLSSRHVWIWITSDRNFSLILEHFPPH